MAAVIRNLPQAKVEDENSLFFNKVNRNNLIGVCFLWSMSGFCFYLLVYYSKYFAGNFYLNYSLESLSDCVTIGWATMLSKRLNIVQVLQTLTMLVTLFGIITLIIKYTFDNET